LLYPTVPSPNPTTVSRVGQKLTTTGNKRSGKQRSDKDRPGQGSEVPLEAGGGLHGSAMVVIVDGEVVILWLMQTMLEATTAQSRHPPYDTPR